MYIMFIYSRLTTFKRVNKGEKKIYFIVLLCFMLETGRWYIMCIISSYVLHRAFKNAIL